jgi:hypothetical protein
MNDHLDDERDLSAAFHTLRHETNAAAAPFRSPVAIPAHRGVQWHARPMVATALLAAAMVTVVVVRRHAEREALIAPFLQSTQWESPTDYLLTTPGQELLSAIPTVGSSINDTNSITDTVKGTPQ